MAQKCSTCIAEFFFVLLSGRLSMSFDDSIPVTVLSRSTHTGRDSATQGDFLVLKSQQICSLQSFIEKFITFHDQLLESYIFISTTKFSIVDRFICFRKMKNRAALPNRVRCWSAFTRRHFVFALGRDEAFLYDVFAPKVGRG